MAVWLNAAYLIGGVRALAEAVLAPIGWAVDRFDRPSCHGAQPCNLFVLHAYAQEHHRLSSG